MEDDVCFGFFGNITKAVKLQGRFKNLLSILAFVNNCCCNVTVNRYRIIKLKS